jgi:hypothetical protein
MPELGPAPFTTESACIEAAWAASTAPLAAVAASPATLATATCAWIPSASTTCTHTLVALASATSRWLEASAVPRPAAHQPAAPTALTAFTAKQASASLLAPSQLHSALSRDFSAWRRPRRVPAPHRGYGQRTHWAAGDRRSHRCHRTCSRCLRVAQVAAPLYTSCTAMPPAPLAHCRAMSPAPLAPWRAMPRSAGLLASHMRRPRTWSSTTTVERRRGGACWWYAHTRWPERGLHLL